MTHIEYLDSKQREANTKLYELVSSIENKPDTIKKLVDEIWMLELWIEELSDIGGTSKIEWDETTGLGY